MKVYGHEPESGALEHLIVGPAANGAMLELVIIIDQLEPANATIIHAMPARKGFIKRLEQR